ncbi:AbrB/MazE/SpoVT family DNA-binding domain-containing protein [Oceanobacillus kimchii]|uniref:AbrB/MazE/SpoVT family DNA-binding domain-containing protein n=1 Tax=Oceanobacillus kimchii TaxID=746691 RepID=UPI00034DBFED|nr:AbrB/MazE/SpoVT family DNA-binding domain-containing protein [Oceanobacillus kimchii]
MYRKIDSLGRIVLPREILNILHINSTEKVNLSLEEDHIVLRKNNGNLQCMITGEISDDNIILGDGEVVLSKKAALSLVSELENIVRK